MKMMFSMMFEFSMMYNEDQMKVYTKYYLIKQSSFQ